MIVSKFTGIVKLGRYKTGERFSKELDGTRNLGDMKQKNIL